MRFSEEKPSSSVPHDNYFVDLFLFGRCPRAMGAFAKNASGQHGLVGETNWPQTPGSVEIPRSMTPMAPACNRVKLVFCALKLWI
jgi:hypothetical protein